MLSLDKTKDVQTLTDWLGDQKARSFLEDGRPDDRAYLSVTENCVKAVTRGNGDVGEVITNNAKVFKNVPSSDCAHKGELTLRGEAVIKYS